MGKPASRELKVKSEKSYGTRNKNIRSTTIQSIGVAVKNEDKDFSVPL